MTAALFSPSTLTKARSYLSRTERHPEHPEVWFVQGSEKRPYRVQVTMRGKRVTMVSCTCKFGLLAGAGWTTCSHAAAVLMKLHHEQQAEDDRSDATVGVAQPQTPHRTPKNGDSSALQAEPSQPLGGEADRPSERENPNDTFDPHMVTWITSPRHLSELWQAMGEANEIVLDLETTGLDEHATGKLREWPESARIVLAAITLPREDDTPETVRTFVLPLSHPDSPLRGAWRAVVTELVVRMEQARLPLTNHNLKFDLRWLHAFAPVDLSHLHSWDTQLAAHLLDENDSTKLKVRAPKVFGIEAWDDHDLSTPAAAEKVPMYELGLYAARDTYWTWRLARWQRTLMNVGPEHDPEAYPSDPDEAEEFRLGKLALWCAMPTGATLTGIEQRGLRIDLDWVHDHIDSEQQRSREAFEQLRDRYRFDEQGRDPSFAPTSLWFRAWAEEAVRVGDLEVVSMTASGNPQWTKSVLNRLDAAGSPVAATLLALRDAEKKLQFLRGWLPMVTPAGTIHTTYHAGRVVTGRLSSSGPNVQQITGSLKPAFIPRPGRVIAEIDLSQIELRVAAFISRSEPMIQAYRVGEDLHRALGARMANKLVEDVTSDERQRAKAGNFGFLYGMGAAGFRDYALDEYAMALTEQEAIEIRAHFFAEWEGIAAWHARAITQARTQGQVVSPIGRVRRLPYADDLVAINAPVQGFASDLMQMAAATIAGNLPTMNPIIDAHLVGTVHDSILVEVPEDDWETVTMECMGRMVNLNPILRNMGCTLDVPLAVEATVGTRWGWGDVGSSELTGTV